MCKYVCISKFYKLLSLCIHIATFLCLHLSKVFTMVKGIVTDTTSMT